MELYNLKHPAERVNFAEAVRRGLGQDQGLFFPTEIPRLNLDDAFWQGDFVHRAQRVLGAWLNDELGEETVNALVRDAFNFPLPLVPVEANQHCLELFHGPTLAFKDFGARFLARTLSLVAQDAPMTILTATSGDTGAAVADAFYGLPNIQVVVLYPDGGISELQEKLFCTLGGNVHTLKVSGSFDDCQGMVKAAFSDAPLKAQFGLTSANSINIARLLAQTVYYFEALAQLPAEQRQQAVFAVPSGNFGNLTAGLLAKAMGAPIRRFVAATNSNDTVPRYLKSGQWQPGPVHATLSNAMDVTSPNNWPRVEALFAHEGWPLAELAGERVSEAETQARLKAMHQVGYLSEPHAAVASEALVRQLEPGEVGVFLGTAHPAKFQGAVEAVLTLTLPLPPALAAVQEKAVLSEALPAEAEALKAMLRARL
ncbi:threonine synthase [Ferrimonas balearica]|uniref:threonine synthase n=1 Tax=Ferrimonas balearica TaxID=44012 RepID=UPI001C98FE10|nr:threonine synthase [Ferrimonas balearica]MBY5993448.1 threonine synthase [Ferrimonas balearica]